MLFTNGLSRRVGKKSPLCAYSKEQPKRPTRYAGTIFGCAQVAGPTEYDKNKLYHFGSRFFAPLEQIHIFKHPLRAEHFAEYVKIGQSATTPLWGSQFEGIRTLLAEHNRLPDFLKQARFGEKSLRDVNKDTWREISCSLTARFIHEGQLRVYLLDYLLSEIKDEGTPLLKECKCHPRNPSLGLADYFIRVADHWIPVEAKINILAEKDILSQVAQYVQINSFTPT